MVTRVVKIGELPIADRVMTQKEYANNYETISLRRGLDLSKEIYDKIMDASEGAIPEERFKTGVGINVSFEVIGGEKTVFGSKHPIFGGKRTFLGIKVSEEGWYAGKPKEEHISTNDPDATHVLVRVAVPPESIAKKLFEAAKEIAEITNNIV